MEFGASLVTQMAKNPPAMQATWVGSLSWEDPLEEGMAIHSSILAWRISLDRGAWQTIVHDILQARMLEWVTLPSSRGPSQPKDQT